MNNKSSIRERHLSSTYEENIFFSACGIIYGESADVFVSRCICRIPCVCCMGQGLLSGILCLMKKNCMWHTKIWKNQWNLLRWWDVESEQQSEIAEALRHPKQQFKGCIGFAAPDSGAYRVWSTIWWTAYWVWQPRLLCMIIHIIYPW